MSRFIHNVGVFRGIPISAQLFIIYADDVVRNYTCNINLNTTPITKLKLRNIDIGSKWAKYLHGKPNATEPIQWPNPGDNETRRSNTDYVLFPDDTGMDLKRLIFHIPS